MNTASIHTRSQSTAQAAHLFAFKPLAGHAQELMPFADNHEHLKALELEAAMLLACTYMKRNKHGLKEDEEYFFPSFPLITGKSDVTEAQAHHERIANENRLREQISIDAGVQLNFVAFCTEWELDSFEHKIVMLLLMQYSAPDFIALYGDCEFEKGRGNGMEIGTLLSLLCAGLKEQLEHRRYFSVVSTLFKNDLIAMNGSVDDSTNILDEKVFLPERLVRFILGDNNLYNSCFRYIKREKGAVSLDQIILSNAVKEEVVSCAENYLRGRNDGSLDELDGFYGYGTGLTMLFYGPSGTGKTMLARALATKFDRPVFALAAEDMREMPGSYDEILGTLFREAALQGAIVFLDECDDLFENNGRASRALLLEMEKARCLIIMATNKPITLDPAIERRISLKVPFGIPDAGIRRGIWQALIPDSIKLAEDVDLDDLAQRYQFSGGLIKNSIFLALTLLKQASGSSMTLTAAVLEQAASKQISTLGDEQQICRHINPAITIDSLPLKVRQRTELKNLPAVWDNLKKRQTGLALIISATDIVSGAKLAEALAKECGLKLRTFNYESITSSSEANRMIDPVTQRKILPLDYAFAPTSTEAAMTVFVDHEGVMDSMLNMAKELMADQLMRDLLARLRKQTGLFCMVTKEVGSYQLPSEFSLLIRLEHPGEETQMRHWEKVLDGLQGDEEKELLRLVEASPLHINEIDFVVRQAGILSTIRRMNSRPSMAELGEVIAGFRKSNRIPLLFGGD